ncbi:MAG: hypothetical protein ABIT69_02025 [Sphingomicrobium sp.]
MNENRKKPWVAPTVRRIELTDELRDRLLGGAPLPASDHEPKNMKVGRAAR